MSKLPEGWEEVKLGDISNFYLGLTYTPKYVEEGIPFLSVKDINKGYLSFEKTKYISEKEFHESTSNAKPKKGDIIFGRVGTLGNPIVVDFDQPFCIFVSLGFMRVKENTYNYFLKHWISSDYFMKQVDSKVAGSAQKNLNVGWLKKFTLPLPPLSEQKKIAEILSTVEQKIAFVDNQIEETELLKKGLMQKLLTEGIGHTEFKDSELGRIPVEWEVKKIEEVCSRIIGGGTPNKNESAYWNNGTILWVTPSEFTKSDSNYISTSENKISEEGLKNSSATLLKPYTVIMSSRATIGECKINTIEMTTNQGFISFECNELLKNLYLLYLIKQSKQKIIKVSSGSTFLEVSRTTMKNFKISLPPLEEQKTIAEILSTTDEKLENLKAKKESFEELKKGLMQKLLTGEVRV